MSTILFTEQISEFSYIKVLIGFFNYCNVDFLQFAATALTVIIMGLVVTAIAYAH